MKIQTKESLCIAAGRCVAVAEDLFQLDEDGFVVDGEMDVPAEREDAAFQAAVLCPGKAILIVEE